jgi:hypothetical protein
MPTSWPGDLPSPTLEHFSMVAPLGSSWDLWISGLMASLGIMFSHVQPG